MAEGTERTGMALRSGNTTGGLIHVEDREKVEDMIEDQEETDIINTSDHTTDLEEDSIARDQDNPEQTPEPPREKLLAYKPQVPPQDMITIHRPLEDPVVGATGTTRQDRDTTVQRPARNLIQMDTEDPAVVLQLARNVIPDNGGLGGARPQTNARYHPPMYDMKGPPEMGPQMDNNGGTLTGRKVESRTTKSEDDARQPNVKPDISVVEQLTAALSKLTEKPQNMSNNSGMKIEAPKFGGADSEFFSSWKRDYEDFATCMGWSDDMRLRGLTMVLTGRAKQMLQDLPASQKDTWTKAILALEIKHKAASPSAMTNFTLLERVQGREESVSAYTIDMIHRLRVAGVTDESHKLAHYYKGLRAAIKRSVFILQPKTLEECERQAKLVEDNFRINGDASLTSLEDDVATIKNKQQMNKSVSFTNEEQEYDNQTRPPRRDPNREQQRTGSAPRGHRTQTYNRQGQVSTENPPPIQGHGRQTGYPSARQPVQHQYRHRRNGFNNQGPQYQASTNQQSEPFCTQCQMGHPWGQHVNPTCARCGTQGHTRHQCQGF